MDYYYMGLIYAYLMVFIDMHLFFIIILISCVGCILFH